MQTPYNSNIRIVKSWCTLVWKEVNEGLLEISFPLMNRILKQKKSQIFKFNKTPFHHDSKPLLLLLGHTSLPGSFLGD